MEPVHWAILLKPILVPIFMWLVVKPLAWVVFKLIPDGRVKVALFRER